MITVALLTVLFMFIACIQLERIAKALEKIAKEQP